MLAKKSKQSRNTRWARSQGAEPKMPVRVLNISESAVRPLYHPAKATGHCKTIEWPKPIPEKTSESLAEPVELGCFKGIRNALLLQFGAALAIFGAWLAYHAFHLR